MNGFKCKRCGRCCITQEHIEVCEDDVKRWKKEGRRDLYNDDMLAEWDYFGGSGLFRNETTSRCPFLRKNNKSPVYYCRINDTKPLVCKRFPIDIHHANNLDCPGYDDWSTE